MVQLAAVSHPAAVLIPHRVVMRPVHDAAQIVPLVQAAQLHAVAHAKWHAFREINIVRDQQRLVIADVDDEALMS